MAMNEKKPDTMPLNGDEMDSLFAAVRDVAPAPRQELWDRVHQDALAMQPDAPTLRPSTIEKVEKAGILAGFLAAIGGWPSLAGLTLASCAGLWIGIADPASLSQSAFASWLPGSVPAETFDLDAFEGGFRGLTAILEEG